MTLRNDFSLQLAFSSAVSTTRRDPDPCSRISRLDESNCSRVSRSNSKSAGAINTISSSMNGLVRTSRSRAGPSISPIETFPSTSSRTISAVSHSAATVARADARSGMRQSAAAIRTVQWSSTLPAQTPPTTFRLPMQVSPSLGSQHRRLFCIPQQHRTLLRERFGLRVRSNSHPEIVLERLHLQCHCRLRKEKVFRRLPKVQMPGDRANDLQSKILQLRHASIMYRNCPTAYRRCRLSRRPSYAKIGKS